MPALDDTTPAPDDTSASQADGLEQGNAFYFPRDAVIQVTGDDAESWLNGQLTQDVLGLTPGVARYALVVAVKGKMISDLWVYRDLKGDFGLVVPQQTLGDTHEALECHLIMEDATLEVLGEVEVLSFPGRTTSSLLELLPDAGDLTVVQQQRAGVDGVDVVGTKTAIRGLRAAAEAGGLFEATPTGVMLLHARHAAPRWGVDFGSHYPQEASRSHGVSFTKGCYVGQEVVCRLEHRGKVQRKLMLLSGPPGSRPADGAKVYNEQEPIGEITSVVADRTQVWAFAFIKTKASSVGQQLQVGDTPMVVAAPAER